jgi:hypothetical protein
MVPAFPDTGCTDKVPAEIAASEDHLFLYEVFGGKIDRRRQCGEQMLAAHGLSIQQQADC